jgi:hypothetical protein
MAIVVMHIESETNYVMLGTGFGAWATDKPGFMGFSDRNDGFDSTVFVCDVDGVIGRFAPSDLVVVSVDGEPVSAHLGLPPSTL